MFRRLLVFCAVFGLSFQALSAPAPVRLSPRQAIYYYAHNGNVSALLQLKQQGYPIDLSDNYGNSALCEAVLKHDEQAISTLLRAGADSNAYCMQAIASANQQGFVQGQTVQVQPKQAESTGIFASSKKTTVPSPPPEPFSKNTKVGIGLGVVTFAAAGTGLALLVSGGGGKTDRKCVMGMLKDNVCKCNEHVTGYACDTCEAGYIQYNGACYVDQGCGQNSTQVKNTCQCKTGYIKIGTDTKNCYLDLGCGKYVEMHQEGENCVCNSHTPALIKQPLGCFADAGCSSANHLVQLDSSCVCASGYPVPTYDSQGVLTSCSSACSGTHKTWDGQACVCQTGYTGTDCSTCASGYGHYGDTTGECYATLKCNTAHGHQEKNHCACNTGWTGDSLCNTGSVCGPEFVSVCPTGYQSSATCQHGDAILKKCDQCAVGYTGEGCASCSEGYTKIGNICAHVEKTAPSTGNDADITINNSDNGNRIALYNAEGSVVNAMALPSTTSNVTRAINIANTGTGDMYGIYAGDIAYGTRNTNVNTEEDKMIQSTSNITIGNHSGNAYGIYAKNAAYGAYNSGTSSATSNVKVTDKNGGTVYGIYSAEDNVYGVYDSADSGETDCNSGMCSKSVINLVNKGGTSTGIYSAMGNAYGVWDTGINDNTLETEAAERSALSTINIKQWGGTAYGMRGVFISSTGDSKTNTSTTPESIINIRLVGQKSADNTSVSSGEAIGMRSLSGNIVNTKTGKIDINLIGGHYQYEKDGTTTTESVQTDNTKAIGIYADTNVSVTNAGDITIKRVDAVGNPEDDEGITKFLPGEKGYGYGIYVVGNNSTSQSQSIRNTGTINVLGNYDHAYGIYVENGNNVTVTNTGTITVDDSDGYGIYFKNGNGGKVTNSGTIVVSSFDDWEGDDCMSGLRAVHLGGAQYVASGGSTTASLSSLSLASFGGTVVAQSGSNFSVTDNFSGTLHIDPDTVMGGFKKVYTEHDMIQAGTTAGLNLVSNSALFDASLNGQDVVMTMKGFDTATTNKSLSKFLTRNYALGNNEAFYNKLKSFENTKVLTDSLNKLTGKDMLSRFNFEDMTMMRELNFDMNEKLFHNPDQHFALAGSVSPMAFRGDMGSNAKYSLYNKRDGHKSIGLGVAFTNTHSDDNHENNDRHEAMYQLILPMGYRAHGFNLMTSPRIGYARGAYDRTGFNGNTYDGVIEKRVFGLMNEARYPITLGKWKLEPSAEFNVLGYQQRGHEDAKEFALNIQNQNTYSVEGGIGLYATREEELDKDTTLKLTAGIAAYHEFADPYRVKVGMKGMAGAFTLYDENRSENRGVIRAGFDYTYRDLSMYGSLISYIDGETRTSAKTGMKIGF